MRGAATPPEPVLMRRLRRWREELSCGRAPAGSKFARTRPPTISRSSADLGMAAEGSMNDVRRAWQRIPRRAG